MAAGTMGGLVALGRAALVVALWCAVAGATAADGEGDGRAALEAAGRAREAAYALADEAREQALLAAARSFEALAAEADHPAEVRVEAAFRAGELLRARGRVDEARALFEQGHRTGLVPLPGDAAGPEQRAAVERCREFAARCLLERGHIERRAERAEAAAARYDELVRDFPDRRRQAAHGLGWRLRMALELGRLDPARDDLQAFGERFPEYPRELLRHGARVLEALLEDGRRAEADTTLERLEVQLAPALEAEEDPEGPLRSALHALRVTLSAGAG